MYVDRRRISWVTKKGSFCEHGTATRQKAISREGKKKYCYAPVLKGGKKKGDEKTPSEVLPFYNNRAAATC